MDLSQFLNSDVKQVQEVAVFVNQYKQQLDAGQISQADFNALCTNVLNYQDIIQTVNDIELQQKIKQALDAMTQILIAASGFIPV